MDYDGRAELFRIHAIVRMIRMAHMLGGDAVSVSVIMIDLDILIIS